MAGPIRTCFFDLDDTLYPHSSGLGQECTQRIRDYMVEALGFSPSTVDDENAKLYRKYGTTMSGLRAEGYKFSFDDWHNRVHVPLKYDAIRTDPVLRSLLHRLPQDKYVFTNGDRGHAARCLAALGVEDCLHGVIAFEDVMEAPPVRRFQLRDLLPGEEGEEGGEEEGGRGSVVESWSGPVGALVCCKPQVECFRRALDLVGAVPSQSMMFDDSVSNIIGAKRMGMHTVLVGSTIPIPSADHCVASIHNIDKAVPELWAGVRGEDALACPCPCGNAEPMPEAVFA